MSAPIAIPTARLIYDRLVIIERELLLLSQMTAGYRRAIDQNVMRVRALTNELRPTILSDGAQ